jgi:hypothetical protein
VAHASNLGTPDATVPDTPTAANSGPPPLVDADLDAGENPPGQIPETDAGSKPQTPVDECADTSVCSGSPQECATKRSRCECVRNAPTGQGPECDSCTCELCPRELRDCIESGDAAWDNTCGALTKCFGQGRANNRCVPANCSDVCPNEYVASSDRRFGLFGDPQCEFGSCSAFQALRQQCYAAKCRGVCKF